MSDGERVVGIFEFWFVGKNYGFAHADSRRFFVHASAVTEALRPGDTIEFIAQQDQRGWRALDVRRYRAVCPKCDSELTDRVCDCGFVVA